MSKTITRKYIQRITKREGNTNIRQSSGGGGGGGASQYWVEENYISKLFFNQLFTVYDEDGNVVEPNDTESVIASIKSMFGFWTDAYLSALGNGEGGGAELTLASLADVDVHGVANGQALVYDATTQKWVPGQGGGIDITAMWAALAQSGVQQIDVSHLATALTGYATETWVGNQGYITGSALNGYATESWVGSQISDMATQTWVSGNYLSQTNAAATYLTQTNAAATYLTKTDAATTYVSIAFFERLFKAYNGSTVVHPNNTTSTIDNIKAMFGFWTDFYLSALGNGSGGSTPGVTMAQVWSALGNSTTEQINISHLTTALSGYNPTSNFKTINGNSIIGTGDIVVSGGGGDYLPLTGGTMTGGISWSGNGALPPSSSAEYLLVIDAFEAGGRMKWINTSILKTSQLTNDAGFVTSSIVNGYATETWVSQNYLPLTGGTLTGRLVINRNSDNFIICSVVSNTEYGILKNHNNGNVSLSACGRGLFLGWENTNNIYCRGEYVNIDSGNWSTYIGTSSSPVGYASSIPWTGITNKPNLVTTDTEQAITGIKSFSNLRISDCPSDNGMLYFLGINAFASGGIVRYTSWYTAHVGYADQLTTARSFWGQSFNGTSDVSGNMSSVGSITMSGAITMTIESDRQTLLDICNYSPAPYGLIVTSINSGALMMQSKRRNSTTEFFALCLNQEGGNVGIGTTSPSYKLHVNGTFYASGNSSIGGTFGVTGATTLSSTLGVTGATTLSSTLSVTSNTTVGGTLGVTGATTLSSSLSVSGNSTLSGYVGVGTAASSSYALKVSGVAYASTGFYSGGYVTALSDARHKDVKGDVGLTVGEVANAPAVKFLWKDRRQEGLQVGSIAQYWQKVMPEAIVKNADGELTMSYGVIALLASIATARKVEDHERRIRELEEENKKLKQQLNAA